MKDTTNSNRRAFIRNTALAGLGISAMGQMGFVDAGVEEEEAYKQAMQKFPKGFWWGSATSSYQVEGAANLDGRGKSIWDVFSHIPGKTHNNATGDVSCDQYHRFEEDIQLMADAGIKHYRFSISWPRVLPEGRGTINEKGVDYYRRLTDALLKHGIRPHATLFHWDLPQALHDRYGGWLSREVVNDFGDYASAMVKRLGDKITHWMTINEFSSICHLGYGVGNPGIFAPGATLKTEKEQLQLIHNVLMSHGAACQAIRAASPVKCAVSLAEDFTSFVPAYESSENIEAVKKAFRREGKNGGMIIPVLTGKYDENWLKDRGNMAPDIQQGDMELIHQPLDMLGYNCYTGTYIKAASNEKGYEVIPYNDAYPKGNMPWLNITPNSIYWGIRLISEAAGRPDLPIFISENGLADSSLPNAKGEVDDIERITYYRNYLLQVQLAIQEGYKVKGYFPWSLVDNFEWAAGYSKRFGMIRVDFNTQQRIPKLSYYWYKEVIKNNKVV